MVNRILLALFVLRPLTVLAESPLSQQATIAWQHREMSGQTEMAIGLWDQALMVEPDRGEILISLTKACGRAVRHAATAAERRRWADRAKAYGTKAIEKNPQNSDAFAAYAEALGQWADAHKGMKSLKTVKEAVHALNEALKLDPKNAYAHMLLASFYREAPGLISIGDKEKALEHAKLAVEHGPQYAIHRLVLARCYLDHGQKQEAIKELEAITTLTAPADAVPETRADQETAKKMLQELGVMAETIPCGQTGGYCSEEGHP